MNRAERREIVFRNECRKGMLQLLGVLNPEDAITYGALKYPALVEYTLDILKTELESVESQPEPKPKVPARGLALDL